MPQWPDHSFTPTKLPDWRLDANGFHDVIQGKRMQREQHQSGTPEPANQPQPVTANDLPGLHGRAKDQFQCASFAIGGKTFACRCRQPKTETDVEQWNSRNPNYHWAEEF